MKVRILTSLGMLVFGLPILIFSNYIIYPIGLGALCTIACWELLRVLGFDRVWEVSIPTYIISALLPLSVYFVPAESHMNYLLIASLVVFLYLMYLVFVSVACKGKLGFKNISAVFMSVCYVSVSFVSMGIVRYMDYGAYIFGLIFIGAWITDIMAYFTGRLFGKHKLAPTLSPKKTVEGSIGGVVFNMIAFALYGFIIERFCSLSVNYAVLVAGGLAISVISQIGDLWASLVKREYGIKDYSNLFPGHGGVMDRFDSILPVSTVLMVICILFKPFA